MARFESIAADYGDEANFVYIYIREAHPDDEWRRRYNREEGVIYDQPRTFDVRLDLARTFVREMQVETPTLVDDIRNTVNACYAAWPARIYVIETDGRIAYKSGIGPFHFRPDELRAYFEERYGRAG